MSYKKAMVYLNPARNNIIRRFLLKVGCEEWLFQQLGIEKMVGVWVIVVVIGENTEDNKAYIILNVRNYKSRRFRIF